APSSGASSPNPPRVSRPECAGPASPGVGMRAAASLRSRHFEAAVRVVAGVEAAVALGRTAERRAADRRATHARDDDPAGDLGQLGLAQPADGLAVQGQNLLLGAHGLPLPSI